MDEKSQVDYPASPSLSLRGRAHALQEIEAEIRQEKAETLRRAGERLEDALNALESARAAIGGIEAREQLAARLAVCRDLAHLAYQYLIIQREAVGVRSHLDVERSYRVSERLR